MDSHELPYLIPYLISLLISTSVGVLCWRRRAVQGAGLYALFTFAEASWTLGYVFELASDSLSGKVFWDNFQFIGLAAMSPLLLAFALKVTGRTVRYDTALWKILAALAGFFVLAAFADDYLHLMRSGVRLIPGSPFSELTYDFGIGSWLSILYTYVLLPVSIFLLCRSLVRSQRAFQLQTGAVVLGSLVPVVGGIPVILGITLSFHRDMTPLTFAVGNVIVAWGLFYFRLFDLVPVARDTVIENMRDPVVVVDVQNRVVDLNRAAQAALGLPASAIIGLPTTEVYARWPDLLKQFESVLSVNTEIELEVDHQTRVMDLSISPLYDRQSQLAGRVIVARDITARREIEKALAERTQQCEVANEDLEKMNQELQVLIRVKDEFVANVSHELGTPITNLKLRLHMLEVHPAQVATHLEVIHRETDRLGHLIEALLTLSRLDQNRVAVRMTPLNLNTLAEEYVADRASLAENKGLFLAVESQPNLPLVKADANLMGQTLTILLTNALNYTPTGGKVVVRTEFRIDDDAKWAGFCVQDTGPGISPDEQARLFNRFFRGTAAHYSGLPGSGLGLAIAKEIVERHLGRITVESDGVPGHGTAFHVWLSAWP